MAQETKNKVVVLEPCTKTVEELLKTISDRKQAQVIRVSIPEEALQLVRQFQPCMLVVCLQDNQELSQRVSLLKNLESSIKYGLVKTLFVSSIRNKQAGALITSLGVTDFMEEPTPLRTLQFKSNLQLKAVETIRKQQEQKKASQEKIVFKKNGQKGEGTESADSQAKPAPALQLDEDSFLFKNSGIKKMGKKLVVELEGPDPASGKWVSHEDKGSAQAAWRWVPEDEKESPEVQRGDGWVHNGDKPHFHETSRKWQLASERPELSFQKNGKKVAKKISTNAAGEVSVAADSPKAEENIKKAAAMGKRAQEQKAGQKPIASEAKNAAAKETTPAQSAPAAEEAEIELKSKEKSSRSPSLQPAESVAEKSTETEAALIGEQKESGRVVELKERRDQKEAQGKEKNKKAKGPALSPLDFLKKKKKEKLDQEQEIGARAKSDAATSESKNEAPPEQSKVANRDAEPNEVSAPRRAKGKNKSQDALDRLRARAEEGLAEGTEVEVPTEVESETKEELEPDEPTSLPEAMEESADSSTPPLIGVEKSKKKFAPHPSLVELSPRERKKKVLREVQEMIAEPLPETLPPEEEARLRKKFHLEDSPEVTPAALARKERIEKVKALKESLLELERSETSEEVPERNTHDLSEEEAENTWSQRRLGREKSVSRRAFDSELPEEAEESGLIGIQAKKIQENVEGAIGEDPYFYLPEIELSPVGNAWEKAVEHQVYLAGEIRYRGFARMQDLLPIWIYRGDTKPELLDKTKQWRFLDAPPFSAKTIKEIPADVREFLLALKSEADELSPEEKEAEAALAEIAESESIQEAEAEIAKDLFGDSESAEESQKAEALFESFEKEAKAARHAEPSFDSEPPVTQADTLEEIFDKKRSEKAGIPESLSEIAKSPGIEKFLERRKKKAKSETESSVKAGTNSTSEESAAATDSAQNTDPKNPYLGILVALSNSFGLTKDGQRSLARVLKAIEFSFGRCTCAVLGPMESDGLSKVRIGPVEMPPRLDPVNARPIRGTGEGILGYLLLIPTEGRSEFSAQEEEVIAKVIASIWPAVARGAERKVA